VKAGAGKPNQSRVRVPAERSEARRCFCRHGTNLLAYTSVAVQCWLRAGFYHLIVFWLRSVERSGLYHPAVYYPEGRNARKNRDEFMHFIVRVSICAYFKTVMINQVFLCYVS